MSDEKKLSEQVRCFSQDAVVNFKWLADKIAALEKRLAKVIQERDEARTFIGLNITWLEDYYDAAKSNMSVKHSIEFLRWINACRKIDTAMRQEGE